jgi:hypothetical protein
VVVVPLALAEFLKHNKKWQPYVNSTVNYLSAKDQGYTDFSLVHGLGDDPRLQQVFTSTNHFALEATRGADQSLLFFHGSPDTNSAGLLTRLDAPSKAALEAAAMDRMGETGDVQEVSQVLLPIQGERTFIRNFRKSYNHPDTYLSQAGPVSIIYQRNERIPERQTEAGLITGRGVARVVAKAFDGKTLHDGSYPINYSREAGYDA